MEQTHSFWRRRGESNPQGLRSSGFKPGPVAHRVAPPKWRKAEVLIPRPEGPYWFRASPGTPVRFTFQLHRIVSTLSLERDSNPQRPETSAEAPAADQHVWC